MAQRDEAEGKESRPDVKVYFLPLQPSYSLPHSDPAMVRALTSRQVLGRCEDCESWDAPSAADPSGRPSSAPARGAPGIAAIVAPSVSHPYSERQTLVREGYEEEVERQEAG